MVIQQLVEINPIPVLFMRTVLQALSFYPKMVGFVMSILQRLINKQVIGLDRASRAFRSYVRPRRGSKLAYGRVLSNAARKRDLTHFLSFCNYPLHN